MKTWDLAGIFQSHRDHTLEKKWKVKVKVTQSCLTLCDLTDYTVHGILQVPSLQADSLPAEPQGKPKNTGVGSLSVLQRIFPTQKLNQGYLNIIDKLWFHWLNKIMCVSKQKYFTPFFSFRREIIPYNWVLSLSVLVLDNYRAYL